MMIKKIATVVAAAGLALSLQAMADTGVVDMQSIFKDSPQVKAINASLEKKFEGRKNAIMAQGKALQAAMQDLKKNRSVMSKADLAAKAKGVAKQEADLRSAQAKFQQDLFTAQNTQMSAFMKTVDAAIAKVAKSDKMDLVLPKNGVLYSKDGSDITKDVMKSLG